MHDKIFNKTCVTSEVSDQPAYSHRLVRVFADRMCLRIRTVSSYPKRMNDNLCRTRWMYRLNWVSAGYRFCRALAHLILQKTGKERSAYGITALASSTTRLVFGQRQRLSPLSRMPMWWKPSRHMPFIQRRIKVGAVSWGYIDVNATLYKRHMPAGRFILTLVLLIKWRCQAHF